MTGRDDEHREPPSTNGSLTGLTTDSDVVHQATGFISATLRIPVDTALTILLDEARTTGVELATLARDIITRRRPVPLPKDVPQPPVGGSE